MKLKFRHQSFQADAVNAIYGCFTISPNKINVFETFKMLSPNTKVKVI